MCYFRADDLIAIISDMIDAQEVHRAETAKSERYIASRNVARSWVAQLE